jgi:hypothetical protein
MGFVPWAKISVFVSSNALADLATMRKTEFGPTFFANSIAIVFPIPLLAPVTRQKVLWFQYSMIMIRWSYR